MSAITTHVLDTAAGRPATGVGVVLAIRGTGGDWEELATGMTDGDGRVSDLLTPDNDLEAGEYRLSFDTGGYLGGGGFYPEVTVNFRVKDSGEHYHVPLLLSPYGYSTYRGS